MTWFTITHSCGHEERHNLTGNRRQREWIAERRAADLCSECAAKARAEQNAAAAAANANEGLPALIGSEKQVAWAETIRRNKLDTLDQVLSGSLSGLQMTMFFGDEMDIDDPRAPLVFAVLKGKASASWWIENRDRKLGDILLACAKEVDPAAAVEAPAGQADAALTEATLRPAAPVTSTVCEIQTRPPVGGKKFPEIVLVFPEKREDFRELAKALGYHWDGHAWARTIDCRAAPLADRLAEAGNRLLAAGFAVRLWDADIRAKALAADYAPEIVRWVRLCVGGDHDGRLKITWPREDDLFEPARRLPGAKWIKGGPRAHGFMTVPTSAFAAVEDFVEGYGFTLSDGARDALTDARRAYEDALLAIPAPAPKRNTTAGPQQSIPDGVDPALADDVEPSA